MKSGLALMIAPAGSRLIPQYCEIGSGSGTALVTCTGLQSGFASRKYSSTDTSTPNEVEYVYDFTVTTMSGNTLQELGARTASGLSAGDLWAKEAFADHPHTFTGTEELQVSLTFEFI